MSESYEIQRKWEDENKVLTMSVSFADIAEVTRKLGVDHPFVKRLIQSWVDVDGRF